MRKREGLAGQLLYLVRCAWEVKPAYVMANVAYVLENIPRRLLTLFVLQFVVTAAVEGGRFNQVLLVCVAYLAYWTVASFFRSRVDDYLNPVAEREIVASVSKGALAKACRVCVHYYDEDAFYDDSSKALRAASDVIVESLALLRQSLSSVVSIATLGAAIVALSPPLIILTLACCVASLALNHRKSALGVERVDALSPLDRRSQYFSSLFFQREAAVDLRVEALGRHMLGCYERSCQAALTEEARYGLKASRLTFASEVVVTLTEVCQWVYLAWGITNGLFEAGDFMALFNAAWAFSASMQKAFRSGPRLREKCMIIGKIHHFMGYEEAALHKGAGHVPALGDVTAEGLHFAYAGKPTLSGVSLRARRGQKVAVVGHNGAGKSTLAKLLLKLYEPSQGLLSFDGVDARMCDTEALWRDVAVVRQEFQLYALSVAENVLMREPTGQADVDLARRALEEVGMARRVDALPDGMMTQVGREFDPNGVVFSRGEAQKVAIARALAKDAHLVIMDEPSSNLDPLSEKELIETLQEATRDRILVLISHKLSMTRDADLIVVLEEGQVADYGTHDELLGRDGLYTQMWYAQSERYGDV